MEAEDWIMYGLIAIVVGLIGLCIYSEFAWHSYAVAHHCRRTGESREETWIQYMYDSKGNIIGAIPQQSTEYLYACDDNTLHWH